MLAAYDLHSSLAHGRPAGMPIAYLAAMLVVAIYKLVAVNSLS